MRNIHDPVAAAKLLVDHALARFSTDNLSCMIVRLDRDALMESQTSKENLIGVEGDQSASAGRPSEAEKIVSSTKQKIAEGGAAAVGVSASNSGRGHEPIPIIDGGEATFKPTAIEGAVEEEPGTAGDDSGSTPERSAADAETDSPAEPPLQS